MKRTPLNLTALVLGAMVLVALVAHVIVLQGLADPAENFWIDTQKDASSYYLWNDALYLGTVWLSLGLVAAGLVLSLLTRWWPEVRRPARITTLLGAGVVVSTQLMQPAFWALGTGLPSSSWVLPVRLSLMAVALGALLAHRDPTRRWPTWVLSGGLAILAALMLIPQPVHGHNPQALMLFCILYKPNCDPPPRSCRGAIELPAKDLGIPVTRLVDSIPMRAKAQARLVDRTALHGDSKGAPKAWRSFAGDHPFVGSSPWRDQYRALRNGGVHLVSQQARLIGLALVIGLGLLLIFWRLARRRSHAWRVLLLPLALTALVTATGLVPEWSHVSLLKHLPSTLFVALAIALAVATLGSNRYSVDSL